MSICEKDVYEKVNDVGPGLHVKDGRSIAMQTAQAYVKTNGSKKRVRCRVSFDSSSQWSFISTSIAEMLKEGRSERQERLRISGFGDRDSRKIDCNVHALEVESIKGERQYK